MGFNTRTTYDAFLSSLAADHRDDRFFEIFYSGVMKSPIAIMGLNPGGDPASPELLQQASRYYEGAEHDYVDNNYALAVKMRGLLLESGIVGDLDTIRAIPKFNVIFHRSPTWEALADKGAARGLASTHVRAILQEISPRLLIIEGFRAMTELENQQSMIFADVRVLIPTRLKVVSFSTGDGVCITAFVLAHPTGSRWSTVDWSQASRHLSEALAA